jgi:hypothetical protein
MPLNGRHLTRCGMTWHCVAWRGVAWRGVWQVVMEMAIQQNRDIDDATEEW